MTQPEFESSLLPSLAAFNVGDPAILGAGRANFRTADRELLSSLKAATMADATDESFMAFLNIMQPDESITVMSGNARINPDAWGPTPRSFVRLTQDRSIPIEMQDRLIHEADARFPEHPFTVHTLECSHAGFVFRSDELAAILAGREGPRTSRN